MNLDSSFTQRPVVTSIDIEFRGPKAILKVGLNGGAEEKFPIKYIEDKFSILIEKQLKEKEIGILDICQIHSYYHTKVIDHLLLKALKKGMLFISKLDFGEIVHNYKPGEPPNLYGLEKEKFITNRIALLNEWATELVKDMEVKFKDINDRIENSLINTSDRSILVKKCKEELFDNIYKKHALVVNEIINYACGYQIPESIFDAETEGEIKLLLGELQG